MKIIKATAEEQAAYKAADGLYPLHGWLDLGDKKLSVEDLRGYWSKCNPQWELLTPDGFHDDVSGQHSFLGINLKDILNQAECVRLVPCNAECGCDYAK